MSLYKSTVLEIRDKYPLYNQLLKERKTVFASPIPVSEIKKSQNNYLQTSTHIQHIKLPDEISFTIEVNRKNYKGFLFVLRCINLCQRPFFHYDSTGTAHRNYDENLPLKEQKVDTPHFNCFKESGLSWAYKTEQLKNEKERIALEDIDLCVAHFCEEANIRLHKDDFPKITILPDTLQIPVFNEDPNQGVQFL